jgi:hypothetical protein
MSAALSRSAETRKNGTQKGAKEAGGFPLRDGAALIRGRDICALNPLDTDLAQSVWTFPSTQNMPGVEHARLRSLVA